jgi:hypothetical protein
MTRLMIVTVLLFAATRIAQAQAAAPGFESVGIKPGRTVRVALPGEGRVSGQVQAVGSSGLTLETATGPRTLAALPDTLWTRERAVLPGTIVGGTAGVLGGVFLGLLANALCEYDCGSAAAYAVGGGVLVGVAGAALGTLVGAAVPRWKRRLP